VQLNELLLLLIYDNDTFITKKKEVKQNAVSTVSTHLCREDET